MKNKKTKTTKKPEPASVTTPTEKSSSLPLIALITSIVGIVFSFGSGTFVLVLALLLSLAAIIMGAIAIKIKKIMAIITIVISVLGLLFSVTGFSRGNKNTTPSQETVNSNTDTTTVQNVSLPNTFSKKELGYSIGYGKDWTYATPDANSVVFTGGKGTADEGIVFEMQNILFKSKGGSYENLDDGIKKLSEQVKGSDKSAKIGTAVDISKNLADGTSLAGKAIDVEMNVSGSPYKGGITLVSYPQAQIFFLLEFYGPKEKFTQAANTAISMIKSWKIGQ